MKKYVGIILAVIILIDVIMSFVNEKDVENVFGIEVNVWVYRFLWSLLAFLLARGFVQGMKKDKSTEK
ncbi:MAG: hypothetical protein JKY44_02995 [Flavobacteriaceae bacterium]|nr:hypothetical protein [Flavobacteriaceae bacterium]